MPIIDCQSHFFSAEYAAFLKQNQGRIQIAIDQGVYRISYGDDLLMTIKATDYSVDRKLSDMDRSNIEISIVGPNIPGPEMLDMELRAEGARIINNATAEACQTNPARLIGLAVLPFSNLEETLAEYEYVTKTLGFKGIMLYSHLSGRQVDDPIFEDVFRRIAADGTVIVLHPTVPQWASSIRDHSMIPMMGYMVDHSFALLRIILSGLLERYPKLKIIQPHCGGVLPYLLPRIDEQTEVKRRGREHIVKAPSEYYRDVYLDIVSPSAKTARFALEFQGVDKMVFGSDHPWIAMKDMTQVLGELNLSAQDLAKVTYGNAARLFGLPDA